MKKAILIIVFNEFYPDAPSTYIEETYNGEEQTGSRVLARKPRSARFDEVWENGSGSHTPWNAFKANRVYGHTLQKPTNKKEIDQ